MVGVKLDKIIRSDDWELKIYFRRYGSPIEYQHGVLRHRGRLVRGQTVGDEMDTPLGQLRYYGFEQHFPVDPTGWHFADRRRICRSWSEALASLRGRTSLTSEEQQRAE
jgi:hypothetical protein